MVSTAALGVLLLLCMGDGFGHGRWIDHGRGRWRHLGRHYRHRLGRSRCQLRRNIRRLLREWRRYRRQGGPAALPEFLRWLHRRRKLHYIRFPAAPEFLLWWLRVGRHRFKGRWPEEIQFYSVYAPPEIDIFVPQDWPDQKLLYWLGSYPGLLQSWQGRYNPETILVWGQGNPRFAGSWHQRTSPFSFDATLPRSQRGPAALNVQWWRRRAEPRYRGQWSAGNEGLQIGSQEFTQPLREEQRSEGQRMFAIQYAPGQLQWWRPGGMQGSSWQIQGNQQPNTGGQDFTGGGGVSEQWPQEPNRRIRKTLPFFHLQQRAVHPSEITGWKQGDVGLQWNLRGLDDRLHAPEGQPQRPAFFARPDYERLMLHRGKLGLNWKDFLNRQGRQQVAPQPNDAFLQGREWQEAQRQPSLRVTPVWQQGRGRGSIVESPEYYERLREYRKPGLHFLRNQYARNFRNRQAYLLWLERYGLPERGQKPSLQPISTYRLLADYYRRIAAQGLTSPLETWHMRWRNGETKPSQEIEPDTQENRRSDTRRPESAPENLGSSRSILRWKAGNEPERRPQWFKWDIPLSRETGKLQGAQPTQPLQSHTAFFMWSPENVGSQEYYNAFLPSILKPGAQWAPTYRGYVSSVPWQQRSRWPGNMELRQEAQERGGQQGGRTYMWAVQRGLFGLPDRRQPVNRNPAQDFRRPPSAYQSLNRADFSRETSPYSASSRMARSRRERTPFFNFYREEGGQEPQAQRNPRLVSTQEPNTQQDRALKFGFRYVPQWLNGGMRGISGRWREGYREPRSHTSDVYENLFRFGRTNSRQPFAVTPIKPGNSLWWKYGTLPVQGGQLFEFMRRLQTMEEPMTGREPGPLPTAQSRNVPRELIGDVYWWKKAEMIPSRMISPQAFVTRDFSQQFPSPQYQYKFYRQPAFWQGIQQPKLPADRLQLAQQIFRIQGRLPTPAIPSVLRRQWPRFETMASSQPTPRHLLFWQNKPGYRPNEVADINQWRGDEPPGYLRALYGQDKQSGRWKSLPKSAVSGQPVWWAYQQIPYCWKTQCGGCAQEYDVQGMPYKIVCLQVPQSTNVWQLLQRVFAANN